MSVAIILRAETGLLSFPEARSTKPLTLSPRPAFPWGGRCALVFQLGGCSRGHALGVTALGWAETDTEASLRMESCDRLGKKPEGVCMATEVRLLSPCPWTSFPRSGGELRGPGRRVSASLHHLDPSDGALCPGDSWDSSGLRGPRVSRDASR